MQSKHSRIHVTRRTTVLFILAVTVILSLVAVSFFYKKKPLTAGREAVDFTAAERVATQDSPISNSGSLPVPPDENSPAGPVTPSSQRNQASEPRIIPLRFEEFDQRILLSPREIVTVQIDTGGADNAAVRIDAPNGGSLNRHKAPAVLAASEAARGVQFAVGPTRGLYTLEVIRGGQTRIFEFWVDRETPVGQPGPERTFVH
jgi:hypothetical protein